MIFNAVWPGWENKEVGLRCQHRCPTWLIVDSSAWRERERQRQRGWEGERFGDGLDQMCVAFCPIMSCLFFGHSCHWLIGLVMEWFALDPQIGTMKPNSLYAIEPAGSWLCYSERWCQDIAQSLHHWLPAVIQHGVPCSGNIKCFWVFRAVRVHSLHSCLGS